MENFFDLPGLDPIGVDESLSIERAGALLKAIESNRDFTLVACFGRDDENSRATEVIVVDVETDGIPSRNAVGIQYRERLALQVSSDTGKLVEVLALRKNFPILPHQNLTAEGTPASLCLYFEPAKVVTRTWTPQLFLRRIQWWLEKSAAGELHPADQPVERLFFVSPYELILPWNFDDASKQAGQKFSIGRGLERPDGGLTCFMSIGSDAMPGGVSNAALIHLQLPAIVQGRIEREPQTLGDLKEIFGRRGVNLLEPLRSELQQRVGSGINKAHDCDATILLLETPVKRREGDTPEGLQHRAYFVPEGAFGLGVLVGALIDGLDGKFYSATGLISPVEVTDWQDRPIFPMEVLRANGRSEARRQSGIEDAGPVAVLVGAGSLGSALINIWGRSGWGKWSVIDKDHVKPHNISRHTATQRHIGAPKAEVVANLNELATDGANPMTPICVDACSPDRETGWKSIQDASLVVDASTTLEYPRQSSSRDEVGRHISVFLTPTGNDAVMLAEDVKRKIRVRSLEAQYYRAVLTESWGAAHLPRDLGTYWSGASCRDISSVIPYSRISSHAGTLAEQIHTASIRKEATIRIWNRNSETGAVDTHDVPTFHERRLMVGAINLFIDDGLEQKLRTIRESKLPSETGGVLLGYYDFNERYGVIVDVLSEPSDSDASPGHFERGIEGLKESVAEASRRTAGIVGYIGEWHSHPRGHNSDPSRSDVRQLIFLATQLAEDGVPAIQLIVGERDVQLIAGWMEE